MDADLHDEDEDLAAWISTARELSEDFTGRVWIDSTWEMLICDWPCGGLLIPKGPLIAINSIEYLDADNVYQLADSADYRFAQDEPPRIFWEPSTPIYRGATARHDSIRLELRLGYPGAGSPNDAAGVPNLAKQAIRMMVAHWYENREAVATETRQQPSEMPYGFERLLQPLRILF